MYIVDCWIEHAIRSIDTTYSYLSETEVPVLSRVEIEFHFQKTLIGFVKSCEYTEKSREQLEEERGYPLKYIQSVLDKEPLLTEELEEVALWMKEQTVSTTISCFQCMLPSVIKPSTTKKKPVQERWVKLSEKEVSLTPKQLEAYRYVLERKEVLYADLRKKYPNTAHILIEKEAVVPFYKEKTAVSNSHETVEKARVLTPSQQKALDEIHHSEQRVVLLRGVTGSGKTEIYFQLAEEQLKKGKQVLLLVPEIALTPQMIDRVTRRFGQELAIYHSALSPQEKYEQYLKVKNNEARIVVGTRSAVFLPFTDLGLIVLDEEHETSYKQDKQPSYHCRDVAVFRAKYHHCRVLLASATPSLDSYARAIKGKYGLVELTERVNKTLPEITVIDRKKELQNGASGILSPVLQKKIQERLIKKESTILLLNRRGYVSIMKCRKCEEVLYCPHCDIAMSYHKDIHRLKCHTCGYEMAVPKQCPSCGSMSGFTTFGYGTEKLEEELHTLFPDIRTLRMDKDTTIRKNSHESIFRKFSKGNVDVLLGTQMIAKGLDFPNVTLVGVLQGDAGVQRTDFRSCETTFDLLMQAGGRSGRSDKPGEVVYQVLHPDHYAVQCAAKQDYVSFFKREMHYRHEGMYPPYSYFISVLVFGKDENAAMKLALELKQQVTGDFVTIGIIHLLKIRDEHRFRVLLKGKDLDSMRHALQKWMDTRSANEVNRIQIVVNPMTLD